jgi:uncharacterized membrane protein
MDLRPKSRASVTRLVAGLIFFLAVLLTCAWAAHVFLTAPDLRNRADLWFLSAGAVVAALLCLSAIVIIGRTLLQRLR